MKRILVCEDEDAIRDFVVINLKRSGYDVIDVSNAAQAMAAGRKQRHLLPDYSGCDDAGYGRQ